MASTGSRGALPILVGKIYSAERHVSLFGLGRPHKLLIWQEARLQAAVDLHYMQADLGFA